jgi:hypothetical protein
VVDDISHEGLWVLLREQGVSFQRLKTWKHSDDPNYERGPLNLQPHPGRQWALASGGGPIPRRRATYRRPHGVRHLFAADDLSRDKLYGHIRRRKRRGEFLSFLRYLRRLYPLTIRIAIVLDNYSPHLFHHR